MKPPVCGSDHLKTHIRHFGIAALVSGAAMLFSACATDIEKIKAFSPSEELPVIHAENFETTFSDSGITRFYLKTPELKRFETDGVVFTEFPQGVLLVKYDEQMRSVSRISARYAKQFIREKRWEAKKDVVAVNIQGDTLKTERLIWDENEGRIYSDEFVRVITPDRIITGIGFESDQSLSNWRIRNPRGTIYVELNRNPQDPADSTSQPPGLQPFQPVNIGNR